MAPLLGTTPAVKTGFLLGRAQLDALESRIKVENTALLSARSAHCDLCDCARPRDSRISRRAENTGKVHRNTSNCKTGLTAHAMLTCGMHEGSRSAPRSPRSLRQLRVKLHSALAERVARSSSHFWHVQVECHHAYLLLLLASALTSVPQAWTIGRGSPTFALPADACFPLQLPA